MADILKMMGMDMAEAAAKLARVRTMTEYLDYLAAEAFEFSLEINPHGGVHDSVEEHTGERNGGGEPLGDWISEEQHQKALETGRLIEGRVYANGSVSFFLIWGTELADVIAECAKCCREDRARWMASQGEPPQMPRGR